MARETGWPGVFSQAGLPTEPAREESQTSGWWKTTIGQRRVRQRRDIAHRLGESRSRNGGLGAATSRRSKYLYANAYASVRTSKTSQRSHRDPSPAYFVKINSRRSESVRYPNDVIRRRRSLSLFLSLSFSLVLFCGSVEGFENRWGARTATKKL